MSMQLQSSISSPASVARGFPPAGSYPTAIELEQALGSPFDPASPVSFEAAVRADEEEASPSSGFRALEGVRAHESLVPATEGGRLSSFDDLLMFARLLSRRDLVLTVGIGSTLLAALPVWLWGDAEQRARVADLVLNAGFGTLGVTERAAGSDLVATGTSATRIDAGFRLDGEKWLVGNAGRAAFCVVLARSDPSFGLFLVDPESVEPGTLERLPKVRTVGLRAHDLSGMAFHGCVLPADAAIGRVGRGLEMVATTLQFTRSLVSAMCLGAGDTALRIGLTWARERRLYGAPITELAPVRRLLVGAFADLLVSECVAISAARGLNSAPHRMSLWSAASKYVVPSLCEQAIRDCAEVLSARNYLREGIAAGAFQKLVRDVSITTVFEGTELVQLETVRAQLAYGLRRPFRRADPTVTRSDLFAAGSPVPPWDPQTRRPTLSYGADDEIVDGLDDIVDELRSLGGEEIPAVARLADRVREQRDQTRRDLSSLALGGSNRGIEGYDLARRRCRVHAAACCLHMWLENREQMSSDAATGHWLVICLSRLLTRLGEHPGMPTDSAEEHCASWLQRLHDENRLFSLLELPLAAGPSEGDL
jgi:alkylation response protein AidB-like acyl-CoA dehydrogenase